VATADAWGPTFVPLPHVNVKVSGRPSGSDEAEASNRAVVGSREELAVRRVPVRGARLHRPGCEVDAVRLRPVPYEFYLYYDN